MSLTPEKLRACYSTNTRNHSWAPIMAHDCPMLADAMEIADSCARADIECNCAGAGGNAQDGWWYDTEKTDPDAQPSITQALRYLDARGLLIRQADAEHVVSFLKNPSA